MIDFKKNIYSYLQLLIVFLFIYFTFFYKNIYYLPINDYLDQFYAQKNIKSNYFNFFDLSKIIPNFLNGINYNYIPPSEFHLETILEYIFGVRNTSFYIHLIGRISIFYFSIKIFELYINNLQINITAASFVAFSEFWPFMTLTILSSVLLIFIILSFKDKINNLKIFVLALLPFIYEIYLGGIWISMLTLLFMAFFYYKTKDSRVIIGFFVHLLFIFTSYYRLIYEVLYGVETNRVVKSKLINSNNFEFFLSDFILVNFDGHWHFLTSNRFFITPIVLIYIISILIKKTLGKQLSKNEIFISRLFIIIQFLNLFYAIDHSKFVDFNSVFNIAVHLQRLAIFNHILWPLCLVFVLSKLPSKNFIFSLFLCSFLLSGTALWKVSSPSTFESLKNPTKTYLVDFGQKINFLDYSLMNLWGKIIPGFSTYGSFYQTHDEYYMTGTFDKIANRYEDTEAVFVSYDLDPMIAVFNGLKTGDGYYNIYPKSYNIKFKEVISSELNQVQKQNKDHFSNYGPKVYLFNPQFYGTYNLDNINFCKLSDLPATHMISLSEIKYGLLKQETLIDGVYIYEIKKPNNC